MTKMPPDAYPALQYLQSVSNYPKTLSSAGFYGGYTPFSDSYLGSAVLSTAMDERGLDPCEVAFEFLS